MKRQASVHDVTWFLDLHKMGQLDLNPPYQRRSVWSPKDRRFFLDTIFRNYPCPPIFINKTIDESGTTTYHVVDGKQRLETIILFSENKIAIDKDYGDDRFSSKKFKQLELEEKKLYWNYSIPVDYITITDGLDINEIFDRVNRNSMNLEAQELRHAKFKGWFIAESEFEAEDNDLWETLKVSTKGKAKRMKNVQVISELLMILLENKIFGFSQDEIDRIYAYYDDITDEDLDFDLEKYNEKKHDVISTLEQMERHNNCLTNYATIGYNLYSIWAFLALTKPNIPVNQIAEKYDSLMSKVQNLKSTKEDEVVENEYDTDDDKIAFQYFSNTRGASTDLTQRIGRNNALFSWFNL